MQALQSLLQRWGIDSKDVAGTSLSGEIPISEALVNRLIARRLAGHAHVASVQVTLRDGDEAVVRVEPRARLLPSLPVVVRIEQQPDLPSAPTLRLRWSLPAAGPLAMLAGTVAGYFKALPEGIRIDQDVIVVDLRAMLRARGFEDVLTLVRRAAIHTRPGALIVQVEAFL